MMDNKKLSKYCCPSFEKSIAEGIFEKADEDDETEWFIPKWYHIYFCPFCGTSIKGKGFGVYDIENKK